MCTDEKRGTIKLMLSIDTPPAPAPAARAQEKKPPLEDTVREALEKIDSGFDSRVEWSMIRGLYKRLRELKKPSDRALNVMKMIEPVLAKYGYASSVEASKKGK